MDLADILFGTMTLGERWRREFIHSPELSDAWIDPTVLPDQSLIDAICDLSINQVLKSNELKLACRPDPEFAKQWVNKSGEMDFSNFEEIEFRQPLEIVESLQYLIGHNAHRIIRDWKDQTTMKKSDFSRAGMDESHWKKGIFIDEHQGPVLLAPDVHILPGARIMGPVVLMEGSVVKMGAELYPGSTFGPFTVINGEIKNSIIHDFSAKGHEGYLGDSIVGRWNNFGAGTTVSNVSHTFSNVRIKDWNTGNERNYNTIKRGLITGDFVKLGIGSLVFRGTAIGSFTSISTHQFISGNVSPFTWWSGDQKTLYHHDAMRVHGQRQMNLRDRTWNGEWEHALLALAANSSSGPINQSE